MMTQGLDVVEQSRGVERFSRAVGARKKMTMEIMRVRNCRDLGEPPKSRSDGKNALTQF